jgi:IMP dehydrogenase
MSHRDLPTALTFDDVSLVPQYSEVLPSQVDTTHRLTKRIVLKAPLLSAAMDTVTESATAIAMAKLGGLGVIHKNLDIAKQAAEVARVKSFDSALLCGAAVGPGKDLEERAHALVTAGADLIVVDTAHGHSAGVVEAVRKLRATYPDLSIMAGNVVTPAAVEALAIAGVDAVKVGIGPGSICTTRIVAGVGLPQLSAILQCAPMARKYGVALVADGGIQYSGDLVKAMAAGADAVMLGSLFAGTDEAPGERILFQGRTFKSYRGMGSHGAMMDGSRDRYGQADVIDSDKLVPEGIEGRIAYRGPLSSVVAQLLGGLRSGMGYLGARNIPEMWERANFVRISSAGLRESHVHDVIITKEASNYYLQS